MRIAWVPSNYSKSPHCSNPFTSPTLNIWIIQMAIFIFHSLVPSAEATSHSATLCLEIYDFKKYFIQMYEIGQSSPPGWYTMASEWGVLRGLMDQTWNLFLLLCFLTSFGQIICTFINIYGLPQIEVKWCRFGHIIMWIGSIQALSNKQMPRNQNKLFALENKLFIIFITWENMKLSAHLWQSSTEQNKKYFEKKIEIIVRKPLLMQSLLCKSTYQVNMVLSRIKYVNRRDRIDAISIRQTNVRKSCQFFQV